MSRTRFVAEISSNHNRDLRRAIKMVDAAAEAGCDGVKFQLFKIEELFAPQILANSTTHRERRKWELPLEFIPALSKRTRELGMEFSCTPFYLDAVKELEPFVDFYKIASYELLWHDLFKACIETGKPLIFSTGMSTLEEIINVMQSIEHYRGAEVTVLRCTSAYPTPVTDANLSSIKTLRRALLPFEDKLKLSFGWSDHTVSPAILLSAAFRYQASFIEFHFDLDGDGEEFGPGHCWLPSQISTVIKMVRDAELGNGEGLIKPRSSEINDRNWRADPKDGLRPLASERTIFEK
jgi:sialic acid synthase SpsE